MTIEDTFQGHRAITLASNEQLDTTVLIAALVSKGQCNHQQATEFVNQMLDGMEECLETTYSG